MPRGIPIPMNKSAYNYQIGRQQDARLGWPNGHYVFSVVGQFTYTISNRRFKQSFGKLSPLVFLADCSSPSDSLHHCLNSYSALLLAIMSTSINDFFDQAAGKAQKAQGG
jgi:hypothetical protein